MLDDIICRKQGREFTEYSCLFDLCASRIDKESNEYFGASHFLLFIY